MSRTSAHRPYHARILNARKLIERHDHTTGPCDLPTREEWRRMIKTTRHPYRVINQHRCTWELPYSGQEGLCSCDMCTGRSEKKARLRAGRRRARSQAAEHVGRNRQQTEEEPDLSTYTGDGESSPEAGSEGPDHEADL